MEIPINREHIRKVAEEYGVKVEFNSNTPGVRDPETGEIQSVFSIMEDFLKLEVPNDEHATLKSPYFVHVEERERIFPVGKNTLMAS